MIEPPYPADTLAKGWRFELDLEKVSRSDTWLRARTGALRGALLLLWTQAWQQTPCGTLPDDDELISLLIDMPAATFTKHRAVLMRGWTLASDGRYYHETITARVLSMLEKRAGDAKRSADRRERIAEAKASRAGITDASRVTHGGDRHEFDTKHQAPSTREEKPEADASGGAAKSPRPSRKCPTSFEPPEDADAWTAERTPGLDWRAETEKFRDHTFAKAISDWPGAWRNWMRRAVEFSAHAKPAGESVIARERRVMVEQMTGGRASSAAPGKARSFEQNVIDMEAPIAPRKLA